MKSIVLAQRLLEENSLAEQFLNSFPKLSLDNDLAGAKAVFIKPNLTYPIYREGVTTRKSFVEALVSALRQINKSTRIYIGEGEGGYNSFSMSDGMRAMGYYEIGERYPNVEIVNLTQLPRQRVIVQAKGQSYELGLPELFEKIDFSISCPLPKIHCMTKVTLSHKNQWGCIPDMMRLRYHHIFDEIIGQICEKLKFRYAFLDGKYGLDKNGPIEGHPVEINWFVASNSLGAFDMIVSEMMGFRWREIRHLKMAAEYGHMPDRNEIEILGDIELLKRRFLLKRNFWNYPALAAFSSSKLTQLVYFSRWSGLLHYIMYTFRKRSIEKQ